MFGHKGTPATLSGPVCSGNTQRARKANNSSTPGDSLYYWTDQVMRKTWRKERDKDSCLEKRKCGDVEFQKYVYYLLWVNVINGLLYLIFSLESWPATTLIRITAAALILIVYQSWIAIFFCISSPSDSLWCLQEHLSRDEMRSDASRLDTIIAVLLHQMCFQNAFRASEKSNELPIDPF